MTAKFNIDGGVDLAINAESGSEIIVHHATHHAEAPESKLQAEFAKNTGIWCPRKAREGLEDLMANHGFMAKELEVAWRSKSLGWSEKHGFTIFDFIGEAIFAWTMVIVTTGIYVSFLGLVSSLNILHDWRVILGVVFISFIFIGLMYMPLRYSIKPRHIAIRVKKTIGNKKQQTITNSGN